RRAPSGRARPTGLDQRAGAARPAWRVRPCRSAPARPPTRDERAIEVAGGSFEGGYDGRVDEMKWRHAVEQNWTIEAAIGKEIVAHIRKDPRPLPGPSRRNAVRQEFVLDRQRDRRRSFPGDQARNVEFEGQMA